MSASQRNSTTGAAQAPFLSVFQHAPRGVDVQDLRPLRGRPCGPILDPDAYPGAPNSRTKKVKNEKHGVDRPRPYRDDQR